VLETLRREAQRRVTATQEGDKAASVQTRGVKEMRQDGDDLSCTKYISMSKKEVTHKPQTGPLFLHNGRK